MAVTVRPDQEDALLRVTAYHRRDFDLVVIRSPPREHAPILPSIAHPFPTQPASTLGCFGRLPAEIMAAICSFLDVGSCFRFRQVSRASRVLVSSFPEYRHVAHHALEALRAVLRTGLAAGLTFGALYRALCSISCQLCGSFGGFLFLPTAERCCFHCLEQDSRQFNMLFFNPLRQRAGVSPARLRSLVPVLHTVPGLYGMQEASRTLRLYLVPERVTREALEGLDMDSAKVDGAVLFSTAVRGANRDVLRCMAAAAFPSLDRFSGRVEHGVSCKGCQVAVEADDADGDGDGDEDDMYERRDRAYSRRGFLEHFQSCPEAQRLWIDSCGGTRAVDEPEFTRRRGWLDELDDQELPR